MPTHLWHIQRRRRAGPCWKRTALGVALCLALVVTLAVACRSVAGDYRYEVLLPRGYETGARWPLVLYLHGDGGADDVQLLRHRWGDGHGRLRLPLVLVSPIWAGAARDWRIDAVARIVERVCGHYRIDRRRVYVTGWSRGGDGAWAMGTRFGDRIAALVPVAGEGDPRRACALRDVPVWAWHGLADTVVSPRSTIAMTAAIAACGGTPKRSLPPHVGHDATLWTRVFTHREIYDWMLAQRSAQPWDDAEGAPHGVS